MPSTVTPPAMAMIRLFLGFTLYQTVNFREQKDERHAIRAPDVPGIAAHGEKFAHAAPRSRMMPRTRSIDAAMLYIQKAKTMTIIPTSMLVSMLEVRLMVAPWCSVFHHCTE
jgi:hypothetical protein